MTDAPRRRSAPVVPPKAALEGLEQKWGERWETDGTYRFDADAPADDVFSIDTPPPTVSGSLHVGHVFSYTHTDCVARYQRMTGREVFYPMGWDDNGVPTERRVENYYGVRCDPTVAYDPGFTPPEKTPKNRRDFVPIGRRNFIELCVQLTGEDELVFEALWRRLGLSVDWNQTYTTIDERSRRVSQRAFLDNLARGEAYQADAPSMWDITFRMAVSQAELEDRPRPGAYHDLAFHLPDGAGDIVVSTTRPELVVSCVALVAHPDDERYQPLFGSVVTSPLFGIEVPVLAHRLADPEKGTGAAMICTFGDLNDVIWWRELDLPARAVIGRDGRFASDTPDWLSSDAARGVYDGLAGLGVKAAQRATVELLEASGELLGEPKLIEHPVKFYEKGEAPLEIVQSRQWYIRNGGRDAAIRDQLIARGDEVTWHPAYMQARYTNWIEGLTGDWLVSRQRYFGVPIPVWYPVGEDGEIDYSSPLTPNTESLPIDPQSEAPVGFDEAQRGQPGGFVGDPDIMDTWATSSLTPQIAGGWDHDPELWAKVFPMDLRPQAHDIIRTWLFSTMVRSHLAEDTAPWRHAALSGWILDPDRKKMSKSKGNVVVPTALLEAHGSDAVRYWAANGRPGTDTAFDETQMKVGRRLALKVLNASRFVLGFGQQRDTEGSADGQSSADAAVLHLGPEAVTHAIDRAMLAEVAALVEAATEAFDQFDYARALERTEAFFWRFTDVHLELVKSRAYRDDAGAGSARASLQLALSALLRLFAPHLPFATEEVWSWWMEGSIHRAPWPNVAEFGDAIEGADPELAGLAAQVLQEVRRTKTEARTGMRTPVRLLQITASADDAERLELVRDDLTDAGVIEDLTIAVEADQPQLVAHAELVVDKPH
ncbi:MAG: valine--tRNA ligase [Candidatus Microthrix sp.]|nr:valine--tRNA ligase [Candidatus Microthrix sp.]